MEQTGSQGDAAEQGEEEEGPGQVPDRPGRSGGGGRWRRKIITQGQTVPEINVSGGGTETQGRGEQVGYLIETESRACSNLLKQKVEIYYQTYVFKCCMCLTVYKVSVCNNASPYCT